MMGMEGDKQPLFTVSDPKETRYAFVDLKDNVSLQEWLNAVDASTMTQNGRWMAGPSDPGMSPYSTCNVCDYDLVLLSNVSAQSAESRKRMIPIYPNKRLLLGRAFPCSDFENLRRSSILDRAIATA
jgi:hypothetical protein